MKSLRVVLADDHKLVRAGLSSLLKQMPGIVVQGEAHDGREALELVAKHRPDVVLMDISMAGLNGLEATLQITKEYPRIHVIMLSMHATEEYVLQALRAGASGYLLKDAAPMELELALAAVVRGETYLSPPISLQEIENYAKRVGEVSQPLDLLTRRQREILQLIAEGNNTRDIAERLGISVKTVETHRAQLMDRLEIHDIPGLVRYAIRHGLVEVYK